MKHQFGTYLRYHRKERGLSQEALARSISVSYYTIRNYERGRNPDRKNVELLADALELKATERDAFLVAGGAPVGDITIVLDGKPRVEADDPEAPIIHGRLSYAA